MEKDSYLYGDDVVPAIQTLTGDSIWNKWVDAGALSRLVHHDLLVAMENGYVSLGGMRYFLVQHHYYSRNFTRFLCAIINRLESLDDIRLLMKNLQEEMGIDGDDKLTHADLFQRSLKVLGTHALAEPPLPQTVAFTQSIMKFCRSENPVEGLSALCLGAEAVVPLIYKPILAALESLNIDEDGLEFFRLHIEEDEGHAVTMLEILGRMTRQIPEAKMIALQTGRQAINKRCLMFDAIWREVREQR
jgi:pyrroloquinoline quinone (PQQ) biosynthesis protein C